MCHLFHFKIFLAISCQKNVHGQVQRSPNSRPLTHTLMEWGKYQKLVQQRRKMSTSSSTTPTGTGPVTTASERDNATRHSSSRGIGACCSRRANHRSCPGNDGQKHGLHRCQDTIRNLVRYPSPPGKQPNAQSRLTCRHKYGNSSSTSCATPIYLPIWSRVCSTHR